jgi:hypothetical protein
VQLDEYFKGELLRRFVVCASAPGGERQSDAGQPMRAAVIRAAERILDL